QDGADRVAVAFFGDGALNQGVLLETLNLAAIWRLPVLFVCENNGYAVTMPSARATSVEPTARAAGFGVPAEAVDGMDAGLDDAVEFARAAPRPDPADALDHVYAAGRPRAGVAAC